MDDLWLFETVAEAGNFSAAARSLGLTPSAVSKRLDRMEKRLGAKLLNRNTRSLSLTEAGELYRSRGKVILEQLRETEQIVRHLQSEPRGTLRIATVASLAGTQLAPVLAGFCERYPDVCCKLHLSSEIVDIVTSGVDVALRQGRLRDSRLIVRKLTEIQYLYCASPAYLRKRGTPRSPAELWRLDLAVYRERPFAKSGFQSLYGEMEGFSDTHPRYVAPDFFVLRELALQGSCVSMLPRHLIEADVQQKRLVPLFPDELSVSLPLYAVYSRSQRDVPKIRAFVSFLYDSFRRKSAG